MTRHGWDVPEGFERGELVEPEQSVYDPVRADSTTMAVLEATFGRDRRGKLLAPGWLMWLGTAPDSARVIPDRFEDRVSPRFMLAGEVDRVARIAGERPRSDVYVWEPAAPVRERPEPVLGSEDRVLVETSTARATMLSISQATTSPRHRAPGLMRYLSVVLDRYDESGWRIERVVAARCEVRELTVSSADRVASCEVKPLDALRWWRTRQRRLSPVGAM